MSLLEIRHLQLKFYDTQPPLEVVKDISFAMKEGEILGIVGESGSGKTQTALSVLGLLKKHEEISAGEILFEGKNLAEFSQKELEAVRGKDISMIFQEPMTSLNPVLPVGQQVEEGLRLHTSYTKEECKKRALDMLREVELAEVENIYNRYPHQLSGGMRQRVVIAIALACNPDLLICDEPTTALDVTIQAKILELIKDIQRKMKSLTDDELLDLVKVAKILGYSGITETMDMEIRPKGYRVLNKIHRLPTGIIENIINYFDDFKSIQGASIEDLDEVEGIGEIRATYIKNGLIKMERMASLDMQI